MRDYVFKHIKDKSLKEYKICAIFGTNKFELVLFQPSNAWRADLTQDALSILASQLKMDPEEYYSRIKLYLADTPADMHFKITNKEFTMLHTLENNITMKLFFCPLEKVNYCHYVEKLLDLYYDERNGYKEKYNSVLKDREELKKRKEELEKKLLEISKRKQTDDEVLYSNFVLVLNEKKRQIQHLTQTLQAFKRGRPTNNSPVEVKKGRKVDVNKEMLIAKKEISDSDTDEEPTNYNTDEDYSDHKLNIRENDEIDNLPSTSKQDFSLFLEDSPPHHNLPKRKKINQSLERNILLSPVLKVEHHENQEMVTATEKKLPVDNGFNTQDLLDLL